MFIRILRDSLFRQRRRKAIVLLAVALGTTAAATLADIALDVGDRMSRELKSFGANLVVLPRANVASVRVGGEEVSGLRLPAFLSSKDVLKVKDNFWKNNILDFSPVLDVKVRLGCRSAPLLGTWFERSVALDPGRPTGRFLTGNQNLTPYCGVEGGRSEDRTQTT